LFESGEFVGPGTPTLLNRLRDEAGVIVPPGEERTLQQVRRLRNRIEHFEVADTTNTVIALASKTLVFALDFVGAELEPHGIDARAAANLEAIREGLVEFSGFVEERWKTIEGELKHFQAVIDCYRCGEPAFALEDGARCHFCSYHVDAENGAAEYAWLVLGSTEYDTTKGGDWAVSKCPECSSETLLDTGNVGDGAAVLRWACFSCGAGWNDDALHTCTSCGALHAGDLDICDDCWQYKISGD
jgi:hypothetical protein